MWVIKSRRVRRITVEYIIPRNAEVLECVQFMLGCFLYELLNCFMYINQIEKNEMGGACGTYGGRERCAQGFGGET